MATLFGNVFDLLFPNYAVLALVSTDSPECIGELLHFHSFQEFFVVGYND